MSSKTDVSVNRFCRLQEAENWGKSAPILHTEQHRPFREQGDGIRDKKYLFAPRRIYVAHSPTKLAFYSGERFSRLSTSRRKENRPTVHNEKRRKSASPLLSSSRTGTVKRASALFYFHPLKISFIAASNAAFILFSII